MDFVKDANKAQLLKIASLVGLPEFVKQATCESEETLKKLPPSAFAGIREFPIHTKSACWLSCHYFFLNRNKMRKERAEFIEKRLKAAADKWCLSYNRMKQKFEEAQKQKAEKPSTKWALVVERDGQPFKLYPVSTRDQLIRSARHFYEHRTKYPYEYRRKIASAILDAASEYVDIVLPHEDYLWQASGRGAAAPEKVAHAFLLRARLVDGELRKGLYKFAAEVCREPFETRRQRKYAKLLADIDEEAGLTDLYDQGLPLPEETLFSQTLKEAKELVDSAVVLSNGCVLTTEQIEAMPLMKAAEAVGGPLLETFCRDIHPDMHTIKKALEQLNQDDANTLMLFAPKNNPFEAFSFLS